MTEENRDHESTDMQRMRAALDILAPHFESAQILCTRYDYTQELTVRAELGCGNWYARIGHAKEWTVRSDAQSRLEAVSDAVDETIDGDELDDDAE